MYGGVHHPISFGRKERKEGAGEGDGMADGGQYVGNNTIKKMHFENTLRVTIPVGKRHGMQLSSFEPNTLPKL